MNYEKYLLNNGIELIYIPAPNSARTVISIGMEGGRRYDEISGASLLRSRLTLKGTTTRDAETILRELDNNAISLSDHLDNDYQYLSAAFLPQKFDIAMELLADVFLNPTFAEWEKEIQQMIGAIHASLDMPPEIVRDLLTRTIFNNHPYSFTGTKVLQAIPMLNQELLVREYQKILNERHLIICVSGNMDPQHLLQVMNGYFGHLPARPFQPLLPAFTPINEDIEVIETKAEMNQAHVIMSWYAPKFGDDMMVPLRIANIILGGGMSSRLFRELRDKQGLAYSVGSGYLPYIQVGQFAINIGTSPANVDKIAPQFIEQLQNMQNNIVSDEEFDRAKTVIRANHILGHETNRNWCLDYTHLASIGAPLEYFKLMLEKLKLVTKEDVMLAMQQINGPSVKAVLVPE
jgi:predicted Zn-dependent peptidase